MTGVDDEIVLIDRVYVVIFQNHDIWAVYRNREDAEAERARIKDTTHGSWIEEWPLQ